MTPVFSGFIPLMSGSGATGLIGEGVQTGPATDRELRRNAAGGDKGADAVFARTGGYLRFNGGPGSARCGALSHKPDAAI